MTKQWHIELIVDAPDGRIDGDLDLTGTPITSLPEGLSVGGAIYR